MGTDKVDRLPILSQQWERRSCWTFQRPNCMPCYGPCCTQCHSRMGTGECGPRHVFDTTSSNNGRLSGACVIVDQLLGRPLLHLGCRQVAEWYGAGLCDREVSGWTPACVCCVPMPTQRAILLPGSVNEYQRKLASKQAYYRQFAVVLQLRLVSSWGLQETEMLVLAAAFGVRMGPSKAPGNPHVRAVAWTVGINWSGWLPSDYGDFFWWLCFFTANRDQRLDWLIDWLSDQGLLSPPTRCRLSGRQFYRSKDPTNSIKVPKEKTLQK